MSKRPGGKSLASAAKRSKGTPLPVGGDDHKDQVQDTILQLLRARQVCAAGQAGDAWRSLMEPTRQAAKALAKAGVIDITQKGQVVDPDCFKGPIRLRLAAAAAAAAATVAPNSTPHAASAGSKHPASGAAQGQAADDG